MSQLFRGVELAKASLRIIFIAGCVEFPLCWNRNGQETCRGEGSAASDILDVGYLKEVLVSLSDSLGQQQVPFCAQTRISKACAGLVQG